MRSQSPNAAPPARASMPGLDEKRPLKGTQNCVGFTRRLFSSPGVYARAALAFLTLTSLAIAQPAPPADICKTLLTDASRPPEPPAILPPDRAIRVLVFGDFGDGSLGQKRVAAAMDENDEAHAFDFGITLGDNFYPQGLDDLSDPRWERDWETMYDRLKVRIYATYGNHDYMDAGSPQAEIRYSLRSESWCLPRPYYTFTAGPVQFFAIDTNPIRRKEHSRQRQLQWLDQALAASKAPWKVVYGHHPIFSTGEDGGTPEIARQVLPILKRRHVDIYLAGHQHDMESLRPEGGVRFFVSGTGGHDLRPLGKDHHHRRLWAVGKTGGFTVLEAEPDAEALQVSFFDAGNVRLCRVWVGKGAAVDAADCESGG
ncbi:MAG: metallophosphoesterase [Thermoanaerobaculia bacterium]